MSKTVVYLIRHAEAEGNFIRRFHGITDSDVTEKGKLQTQKLTERLKNVHFDVIYSSPLKRAFYTANQIANGRNVKVIVKDNLIEINGGEWEDRCWDELPLLYPTEYEMWEKMPHKHCMPNGESMFELYKRAVAAFEDIVINNLTKTICIVTHGTLIRALLTYIKGIEFEKLNQVLWQDNTAINIIEYENGKYNLIVEGDCLHLGNELSTIAHQKWWQEFLREREIFKEENEMQESKYVKMLKDVDALLEGHFLLTSGKHSSKYLQCAKILQYPNLGEVICKDLAKFYCDTSVDVVIGPAIGAVILSYEMARHLDARSLFAEREDGIMRLRRGFKIEEGEKVLVVEDVITTGGSVSEIIEIVKEYKGEIVGIAGIVDRSGGKVKFEYPLKTLLTLNIENYEPHECPLCKEGIPLIKPGSRKR